MDTTANSNRDRRLSKSFFVIGIICLPLSVISVSFMWKNFFVRSLFAEAVGPVLWLLLFVELFLNAFFARQEKPDQARSFAGAAAVLLLLIIGIATVWWVLAQIALVSSGSLSLSESALGNGTLPYLRCLCAAAAGIGTVGLLRVRSAAPSWRSVYALSLTLVILSMYVLDYFNNSTLAYGFNSLPEYAFFAVLTIAGLLSSVILLFPHRKRAG